MMRPVGRRHASVVGSWRWIATLAALNGVVALAIDMSLPAQPALAATFSVSAETAALNLSLFMIPFAIVQIFIGYLSDAIGRRVVMLGGLVLFTAAGIACALSPTIEVLLVCRALQGAGAAAGPVVVRAMIRDTQPPGQAARLLSTMLATLAIAPMIAPTLGTALMNVLDWRAIYGTLAICGVALFVYSNATIDETLPVAGRTEASVKGLIRGYARFFAARGTRLPVIISSASFAGLFAYVAGSPFVLMEGYGVAPEHYGLYFALGAVAIMVGSIGGGRMLRAGRSPATMIVIGASTQIVAGALVFALTGTSLGLAGFLGPVVLYFVGSGITSPSSMALAMEPLPELAGTASSAVGSSAMICGAIAAYATTKLGASSPRVFATFMAAMATIVFVFAVLAAVLRQKQHESR